MYPSRRLVYPIAIATGLVLPALQQAHAAVSYTAADSTYTQTFDSLPITPINATLGNSPAGWTDDNTSPGAGNFSIPGWYLYHPLAITEGGFNSRQRMRVGSGNQVTGAFMSFGVNSNTDRALGAVNSLTLAGQDANIFIGLKLHNDTGSVLDSFTLNYNGEQWRDGGNTNGVSQSLLFSWSTAATSISAPTTDFTAASSLNFTSPVFADITTGATVNGNTVGRVAISATVTGINWLPDTDLWLRWADKNDTGNDHGLAIDDVVFSAAAPIPEPTTFALLGLGGLAAVIARRNRK